jgi:hypothetical protein
MLYRCKLLVYIHIYRSQVVGQTSNYIYIYRFSVIDVQLPTHIFWCPSDLNWKKWQLTLAIFILLTMEALYTCVYIYRYTLNKNSQILITETSLYIQSSLGCRHLYIDIYMNYIYRMNEQWHIYTSLYITVIYVIHIYIYIYIYIDI